MPTLDSKPAPTLLDRCFLPVDAASLVVLRVLFGVLVAGLMARFILTGQVERLYLAQTLHFKYPFLGWLPDPSPGVLLALFGFTGLFGLMIALGILYRVAAAGYFLCWSYIFFFDQTAYQNHDYLLCLLGFLFLLMPLNRCCALDARVWPALRSPTVPAWCLWLLRFQIAVVYVFGGIRKLNPDWLHGEPIRSMLHSEAFEHPLVGYWFFSEALVGLFAWGGLVFDLAIVPALLWRRTRVAAFTLALLFHLTNAWLWDIDLFPWLMIAATLLFFPPDYPRRWWARLRGKAYTAPATAEVTVPIAPPGWRRNCLLAVLALYVAVQVLLPCRPFLYPGHPLEQQDLLVFSWNMMLRLKETRLKFIVVDNDTKERWEIPPEALLSPFQLGRMGSPDMMHQTTLYLAERSCAEGHPHVAVFVDSQQRLNARPWQTAYDPTVDFAATPRTLGAKPWALPLESPVPPNPAQRKDFYRAKWKFCKTKGWLPLSRAAGDSTVALQLQQWTTAYHRDGGAPETGEE